MTAAEIKDYIEELRIPYTEGLDIRVESAAPMVLTMEVPQTYGKKSYVISTEQVHEDYVCKSAVRRGVADILEIYRRTMCDSQKASLKL